MERIEGKLPNMVRFDAIHGKKCDREKLIKEGKLERENDLLDGQLGCALSHLACMDLIKNQKEPYGLILEDDVIIPENFSEIIEDLKKYFPKKWDIIFLGGCNIFGKKVNEKLIKPTSIDYTRNLCMHAVLLNKDNVQKVIDKLTPLYRPIDSQLRIYFKDMDVFYANPNIINQNKDWISNRRILDGLPQSEYWKKHHMDINFDN